MDVRCRSYRIDERWLFASASGIHRPCIWDATDVRFPTTTVWRWRCKRHEHRTFHLVRRCQIVDYRLEEPSSLATGGGAVVECQ